MVIAADSSSFLFLSALFAGAMSALIPSSIQPAIGFYSTSYEAEQCRLFGDAIHHYIINTVNLVCPRARFRHYRP